LHRDLEGRADPVYAEGAAFYVALLKYGYYNVATEFAEWFLDTFELDLET
jgi:hypothetical protein